MIPRLMPLTRTRLRIEKSCFGLRVGEVVWVTEGARAIKGQLVIVDHGDREMIAKQLETGVELPNGTATFLYKLIGVIDRR